MRNEKTIAIMINEATNILFIIPPKIKGEGGFKKLSVRGRGCSIPWRVELHANLFNLFFTLLIIYSIYVNSRSLAKV